MLRLRQHGIFLLGGSIFVREAKNRTTCCEGKMLTA